MSCALCGHAHDVGAPCPRPLDAPTIDAPRADALVLEDRYAVGALLARGGMGEVFEGWDRQLGRPVAIKLLAPRLISDADVRARFRREAEALARLDHPHIVAVYAVGEHERGPYFVMARLRGRTLAEAIRARGRLTNPEVVRIGLELASALGHLHAAGFVHRDVKPANVMIGEDGAATLLDFGVVRAEDSRFTTSGTVVGTPEFMAPEQARDSRLADGRSDLYALGATLYAAWVGAPPFAGASTYEIIHAHHTVAHQPPSARVDTIGPAIDAFVARALAKDPGARFADAPAMAAALAGLGRGQARATSRARRAGGLVALSGLVMLVIGGLAWMSRAREAPSVPSPSPLAASPMTASPAAATTTFATAAPLPSPPAATTTFATAAPPPTTPAAAPHLRSSFAPTPAAPTTSVPRAPVSPIPAILRIVTLDRGLSTYATISIDRSPPMSTPVAGLQIEPGNHVMTVERPGYRAQTISFTVTPGEHRKIEVEIEHAP